MVDMSKMLAGRLVQPGSQKFGTPAHEQFQEVVSTYLPHVLMVQEPKVFQKAGFWAFVPDFSLVQNNLAVFFELKRQMGRGNAHERLYKLFTEKRVREVTTAFELEQYPVYGVLCDSLATDLRYTREFEQTLDPENYLLWIDYRPHLLVNFIDDVFFNRRAGIPLDKLAGA